MRPEAPPVWIVSNKMDLLEGKRSGRVADGPEAGSGSLKRYPVSALTGASFEALVDGLAAYARRFFSNGTESGLVTRPRHRAALRECADALRRACAVEETGLIAEELRLATNALGRLVGRVDVESVLDVIFRDFCIGK